MKEGRSAIHKACQFFRAFDYLAIKIIKQNWSNKQLISKLKTENNSRKLEMFNQTLKYLSIKNRMKLPNLFLGKNLSRLWLERYFTKKVFKMIEIEINEDLTNNCIGENKEKGYLSKS